MPETYGLEILIEYMLTIGPGISGSMGMVPLEFTEIFAWSSLSGVALTGYQSQAIRDLSRTYVAQSNISAKADSLAPWVKGVDDIETHNMLKSMTEISENSKIKPLSRKRGRP